MNVGDIIKCKDKEDLVSTDRELCEVGYITDFLHEHNGEHGYFVVILGENKAPKERMCDSYCRFTDKGYLKDFGGITQETLEQICEHCPLKEL